MFNTKKTTVFKHGLSKFYLTLLVAFLCSFSISAQTVSTLQLNTGYDNTIPGLTAIGNGDKNWEISNLVSLSPPVGSTINYPAICVTPWSHVSPSPTTPADTRWISYDTMGMNENFGPIDPNGDDEVTFYREFETCGQDSFEIAGIFRSDNRILDVLIDGVSTGYSQALTDNWSVGTSFSVSVLLAQGTHYIEVVVENTPQGGGYRNAIGLNFDGDITSKTSTNSIVDRNNFPEYECPEIECNDLCYWRVTGNTIYGSNNIFGTLTDNDINIVSNYSTIGQERGVIKNGDAFTGGYLGWNTMNPTARLHVDCINGNDDGSGLSDIRFENLETGEGEILVIDPQGYVFRTRIHINDVLTGKGDGADEGKPARNIQDDYIKALESRIEALEAKLNAQNTSSGDVISPEVGSTLMQNTPNPFNEETVISYNVVNKNRDAFIAVYNLNGEQLSKYNITEAGAGRVTISGGKLPAGMYLYSLVVDGIEIDTKRMVLSK